jgi:hypothetical protein
MFEIIFLFYLVLFPVLLISTIVLPLSYRSVIINLRITIQISLIGYSLFLIRQLIGVYQLTKLFGISHNDSSYFDSSMIEIFMIIVLPFLFLNYKIAKGKLLGWILWIILLHAQIKMDFIFLTDGWILINAILFYISLLTAIYALHWILTKFSNFSAR